MFTVINFHQIQAIFTCANSHIVFSHHAANDKHQTVTGTTTTKLNPQIQQEFTKSMHTITINTLIHKSHCAMVNQGPKFSDDLRKILRQFSDLRQSYETSEFTEHLSQILRPILRQNITITLWTTGPKLAYCLKIYPKICRKIILRYHNFSLEMIL